MYSSRTPRLITSLRGPIPRRLKTTWALPTEPCTKYSNPTHVFSETSQSQKTTDTLALAEQYLLPVYARPPFVLSHGEGSWVWDMEGRKYLDFSAGIAVNALGHADPGVVEVLTDQSRKLIHTSNVFHHEWAGKLAELLVKLTRLHGGLGYAPQSDSGSQDLPGAKVFFSNSGTEANEGALKIARSVGKARGGDSKNRIACFRNAFHGRTMGALSVTSNPKYQAPFAPLIPGVDVGILNEGGDAVRKLITNDTCAVIVEPVQGEGGVHPAAASWLKEVRERCDEVGAVLIFDEIQCGLYRTGTLWGHSTLPVECHPDIVTMAKPLANGYPIGAIMLRDSVAGTMTAGTHGTTFGGSPLGCAVGYHVLQRLSEAEFLTSVSERSGYLAGRLGRLPQWFGDKIQEEGIRGKGFMIGIGMKSEKDPARLVSLARERGLFLLTAGSDAVRIVPSLNISKSDIDLGVDLIESCLHHL